MRQSDHNSEFRYNDLQDKANQRLADKINRFDGNNLSRLPQGEQNFGGVDFRIGQGCIQLGECVEKPREVEDIRIGRSFARLHVLQATVHGTGPVQISDGTPIGRYEVRYEDQSTASIPIVYGEDLRDWWDWGDPSVTRGTVAWRGSNEYAKLRLYLTSWENPEPGKNVVALDYVLTCDRAGPFCIAITTESLN